MTEEPIMTDEPILDAERIFATFQEYGVDYILIGGMAVQTHGHVRMTNDADLIPKPDPSNLQRLADALNAMEAKVLNPGHEGEEITAAMLPRSTTWQFTTRDGNIDVMQEVPGGRNFDELSTGVMRISLGEVEIPVVGLDDLVRMKLARGRKIDLEDVAALTDD